MARDSSTTRTGDGADPLPAWFLAQPPSGTESGAAAAPTPHSAWLSGAPSAAPPAAVLSPTGRPWWRGSAAILSGATLAAVVFALAAVGIVQSFLPNLPLSTQDAPMRVDSAGPVQPAPVQPSVPSTGGTLADETQPGAAGEGPVGPSPVFEVPSAVGPGQAAPASPPSAAEFAAVAERHVAEASPIAPETGPVVAGASDQKSAGEAEPGDSTTSGDSSRPSDSKKTGDSTGASTSTKLNDSKKTSTSRSEEKSSTDRERMPDRGSDRAGGPTSPSSSDRKSRAEAERASD